MGRRRCVSDVDARVAAVGLSAGQAAATEPLDGWFIALQACEAFQSKNRQTNPGEVMTEPMRAYAMIGLNAPGGDHFQVKVPGAPVTGDRWVHVSCGVHVVAAGTPVTPLPDDPVEPVPGEEFGRQPAGAELAAGVLRDQGGKDRVPAAQRRRAAGDRDPALAPRPLAAAARPGVLRRPRRPRRPRQGLEMGRPAGRGDRRRHPRPPRRRHARDARASSSATSG